MAEEQLHTYELTADGHSARYNPDVHLSGVPDGTERGTRVKLGTGDRIRLTERQASKLTNRIRRVDGQAPAAGGGGADDGEAKLEELTVEVLTERAEAAGVLPETGSGSGGRVLKSDLIEALQGADDADGEG